MQFDFWRNAPRRSSKDDFLVIDGRRVPLAVVRHPRARNYLLRLLSDGSVRVTIPRGGSVREGRRFAERNQAWIARHFQRLPSHPGRHREWRIGTEVLFRGRLAKIEPESELDGKRAVVRLAKEVIFIDDGAADLRPPVEKHLWNLAGRELPDLVRGFAARHDFAVRRISVRNQKSRWGSCSPHGTVSLNWRLIQTPEHVRDYIILHELCHLRELNHSPKFWREVAAVCPNFALAELWLKRNALLM